MSADPVTLILVTKAPPKLVEESRAKVVDFEARLARLAERLRQL